MEIIVKYIRYYSVSKGVPAVYSITNRTYLQQLLIYLLLIFSLTWQPAITLAQPLEDPENTFISQEEDYEPELIYTWSQDANTIAWAEKEQVIILDTIKHTSNILQLPNYPNLVRVIIGLGFNPSGTKIFTISLVDEPDIDTTVMEIHVLTLDGKILASNVLVNLGEAQWIKEDIIDLTIYDDLSWEHGEIISWNLTTGQMTPK